MGRNESTQSHLSDVPAGVEAWEFPGYGTVTVINNIHRVESPYVETDPLLVRVDVCGCVGGCGCAWVCVLCC